MQKVKPQSHADSDFGDYAVSRRGAVELLDRGETFDLSLALIAPSEDRRAGRKI